MIRLRRGSVLNVSSVGAKLSIRDTNRCSASKAGPNRFAVNPRRELRRTPLIVSLAGVATDMLAEDRRNPLLTSIDRRLKPIGAPDPNGVEMALANTLEKGSRGPL